MFVRLPILTCRVAARCYLNHKFIYSSHKILGLDVTLREKNTFYKFRLFMFRSYFSNIVQFTYKPPWRFFDQDVAWICLCVLHYKKEINTHLVFYWEHRTKVWNCFMFLCLLFFFFLFLVSALDIVTADREKRNWR